MLGHKDLEIGENVLLAQNITLTPYSHHYEDPSRIIYAQGGHCEKVVLGNDVYVGMDVCIMYSGNIGEGFPVSIAAMLGSASDPHMCRLIDLGVSEFTLDHHCSTGLDW